MTDLNKHAQSSRAIEAAQPDCLFEFAGIDSERAWKRKWSGFGDS